MAGLYGKPTPEPMLDAIANTNALKPASRAQIKLWMAKADMRVSGQAMYEDLMVDLRGQLGEIAAPVTVLVPWSAMLSEERALGFYRTEYAGTPKLTVAGVGDSGHFIMLDQPDAFRTALIAFLAS
ncbi:MAG: alpha/beta hydrolase [Sphingomonadales bacterium]|nr:MAG: alpha/beta hydrolase [Sphingomonadales bacterium]